MSEPENKKITDYVEECRVLGEERFSQRHDHPVLLRREDDAVEDEDPSFHTAFMRRESLGDLGRTLAPAAPRSNDRPSDRPSDRPKPHPVGEVLVIGKRDASSPFQDRIGVGRARNADVCILLPKVSKYHAFFAKTADGDYTLTDAGSKNGTLVEGRRLAEKVPTRLENGCEVCFGPYRFTFYTADGFAGMVNRRAALR